MPGFAQTCFRRFDAKMRLINLTDENLTESERREKTY